MKATYEMAERLVAEGLVKKNQHNGFTIYKYAKKVFYDNLWTPELELFRGTVFKGEQLVVEPLRKVYNYKECGTGKDIPLETTVMLDHKVNGFMLNVTLVGGEFLVSTTGSLNSPFIGLGTSAFYTYVTLEQEDELLKFPEFTTFTFEVVHPKDPHVIKEVWGLYLLRIKTPNKIYSVEERNSFANRVGLTVPHTHFATLGEALKLSEKAKHEGWMVYSLNGDLLFKLKTNYYLTMKFLMRSKVASRFLFNSCTPRLELDEEFYKVAEHIGNTLTKEQWEALTEQDRRSLIEVFFKTNGAF